MARDVPLQVQHQVSVVSVRASAVHCMEKAAASHSFLGGRLRPEHSHNGHGEQERADASHGKALGILVMHPGDFGKLWRSLRRTPPPVIVV